MKCRHMDEKVTSILESKIAFLMQFIFSLIHSFIGHIITRCLLLDATVLCTCDISMSKTYKHLLSLRSRGPVLWFGQLSIVAIPIIRPSTKEKCHRVSGPTGPSISHTGLIRLPSPQKQMNKTNKQKYMVTGIWQRRSKTLINGCRSLWARPGGKFIVYTYISVLGPS